MLNLTLSVIVLSVDLLIFIKKRSIVISVDLLIFIKKRSIVLVLNYIFDNNYPIINARFTLSSISSALLDRSVNHTSTEENPNCIHHCKNMWRNI